ncbi:rCG54176 [Rattus norvegicus]|uniref:RCG54176 n=1 Tax=Rattus norvegicus TaxID=10116 RepID=A6JAA3_RAT|nr:rCG54176 [Rattus norvegicus]
MGTCGLNLNCQLDWIEKHLEGL